MNHYKNVHIRQGLATENLKQTTEFRVIYSRIYKSSDSYQFKKSVCQK